jgi:hypothetical protein
MEKKMRYIISGKWRSSTGQIYKAKFLVIVQKGESPTKALYDNYDMSEWSQIEVHITKDSEMKVVMIEPFTACYERVSGDVALEKGI